MTPSTYTAKRGECWDSVAFACYGDGQEFLFTIIMEANPAYRDVLAFEGGEVLNIPKINDSPYILVDSPFGQTSTLSVISTPWEN